MRLHLCEGGEDEEARRGRRGGGGGGGGEGGGGGILRDEHTTDTKITSVIYISYQQRLG